VLAGCHLSLPDFCLPKKFLMLWLQPAAPVFYTKAKVLPESQWWPIGRRWSPFL